MKKLIYLLLFIVTILFVNTGCSNEKTNNERIDSLATDLFDINDSLLTSSNKMEFVETRNFEVRDTTILGKGNSSINSTVTRIHKKYYFKHPTDSSGYRITVKGFYILNNSEISEPYFQMLLEPYKMIVSEVNRPFVFRLRNLLIIYSVDNVNETSLDFMKIFLKHLEGNVSLYLSNKVMKSERK